MYFYHINEPALVFLIVYHPNILQHVFCFFSDQEEGRRGPHETKDNLSQWG